MICFPNAKINLGLHITGKRFDGYHTIETIFYPIPLRDALEVVKGEKTSFTQTGIKPETSPEENTVMKAHALMSKKYGVPPFHIYLQKAIPSGAGLGGGSSDAAFMLKLINDQCEYHIPESKLEKMAASIGADCPFFIWNTPVIATGTGNIFKPADISLKGYIIYIVKPPLAISTQEAYSNVKLQKPEFSLEKLSSIPIPEWKNFLKNDFEPDIFKRYPVIGKIKNQLYSMGAEYASMSGSGSAVFGLFKNTISPEFADCFVWKGTLE
ncbi:MAG: 4-(cytidine 5'-diphospho)-2-C-methyl-D-erythritol kinase [Tannerella sp.]|jgi:4-diphosphocytidyl-2-C-methyl-D-erythritol kinase|nr:4-(cytidine 5'-diphospho)-2-C-methyl-D-erythritol kinase [Tannerella sp.]